MRKSNMKFGSIVPPIISEALEPKDTIDSYTLWADVIAKEYTYLGGGLLNYCNTMDIFEHRINSTQKTFISFHFISLFPHIISYMPSMRVAKNTLCS